MYNQRIVKEKIIIAGAGPAGASLAIRLAEQNFEVCLIEREEFPREKLCGEFISPECLSHFERLGVRDQILAAGGDRIFETVFYEPDGKCVTVPSKWFGGSRFAISLSRAEMDLRLMERAKAAGVEVLEGSPIVGLVEEHGEIRNVTLRDKTGNAVDMFADLFIDATGRARVLGKLAEKRITTRVRIGDRRKKIRNPRSAVRNPLVGFKAHLKNVRLEKGRCEIYSFRGGYAGLSNIENGLSNLCMILKADAAKSSIGKTNRLIERIRGENSQAAATLENADLGSDWLAVAIDSFGRKDLNPAVNLFAVGDSAAFIDPFTGSGMLMALEGSEILARCIGENRSSRRALAAAYEDLSRKQFTRRLQVSAIFRRAAFSPGLAKLMVSALGLNARLREQLARSTRQTTVKKEGRP